MVESLTNCSALAPGKTQINGLSGGAITAVLTTIGKTGREQFNFWRDNLMECGTRYASAVPASCSNASMQCQADVGTCNGHGNSVLKESFYNLFTDQHVKQGESPRRGPGPLHAVCGRPRPPPPVNAAKVRVMLSQLDGSRTDLNNTASWPVTSFRNRYDLASALTTSDYLPCFSGPDTFTYFRNQPFIDGGFANSLKEIWWVALERGLGEGAALGSRWRGAPLGVSPRGHARAEDRRAQCLQPLSLRSGPKGTSNCLKISTATFGPLVNQTCDAAACPLSGPTNCTTEARTSILTKPYRVGGAWRRYRSGAVARDRWPT